MRYQKEHYDKLSADIKTVLDSNPDWKQAVLDNKESVGLRWALYHKVNGNHNHFYYGTLGYTDDHIDTALRKIINEVK